MIDPRQFAAGLRGPGLSVRTLLFAAFGAPVIWSLHLGAVYFLQTLDCISRWDGGGWSIALVTLACAAASATSGWLAWRIYRGAGGSDPATPERDWVRFLAILGMGAAALFTLTILLEGTSPLLAPLCA